MKLQIHPATASDVETLAPLFRAYLAFYGVQETFKRCKGYLGARVTSGDCAVFLAKLGDETVGFALLYPTFSSLDLASSWVFHDLFVKPSARRLGVGARLVQRVTNFIRFSGACSARLETARTNVAAQRLYEKSGWTRDDVFLTYGISCARKRATRPSASLRTSEDSRPSAKAKGSRRASGSRTSGRSR